ncbi:ABC transporter substrate-binding protein [Microbacterium sp. UFMG61]|uniref:ABC transporter substrate-binding protein n=1 Tax=Microbacterium sp. UFMG61 TaxID=2745935 RepID=UPI001E3FBB59|nr:sugar ABC transporter substrate-binding protein [Microbacterium sp. UFMG61]
MNAPVSRRATRLVLTGVAGLAAAALAGCAGSPAGGSGGDAGGPLVLYTWAASEGDQAQWADFIDGAKAEDPDLDITVEGPSFSDYWTKVKTRLSGSNPPCLLTTQAARAQELGDLLMPLDDLIEKSGFDIDDIDASMLSGMTVDGTIRAIPYDAEPIVLFYNVEAFQAAGLGLPGTEYTRDQFIADAKALTDGEKKGLALAPGIFIPNAWSLADGVPAVTEDGELDLTNPEFVDQVQSFFDLVSVEQVAKAPEAADGSEVSQQAFTSGAVPMLIEGPWMYGSFADTADFTLGVTIVPSTSGEAAAMTAGSGFGIAANCDRPDEAFAAIEALTSVSVQEKQAEARGIVPARIEALPAWAEGKTEGAAEVVEALLADATPQRTTPTWNQVETLMTQYGVQGYRGELTAEEIMETIQNSVGG